MRTDHFVRKLLKSGDQILLDEFKVKLKFMDILRDTELNVCLSVLPVDR